MRRMSGTLYPGFEAADEFDTAKWNPLHCNVCNEQYKDPCILQCYHSFCAQCIGDRVADGKLSCPLCGSVTLIKEGNLLPPPDPLLKYLVESSTGETVTCANCDQSNVEMFHCNTCGQSLCVTCREDTHRAKMFSKHDVVLHTKHTRDIQKDCKVHGEPYILFSTEKKLMLCINCFRDMKVESRSHCVDLETAYKQGCQKIDDTMQSIRDLQNSVRDGILLLRALLEEIQINADKEKQDVNELYDIMQEKIKETKQSLLQEIDRQFAEKEELFKNQLISLKTFLPTLHVHLVTCAAFCSSTSKYEFLDFTYELMKRLTAIIQVQQPLHPSQTSEIFTEHKVRFAKCLEPLLFPPRNVTVPVSLVTSCGTSTRFEATSNITTMGRSSPSHCTSGDDRANRNREIQNKKKLKLKMMENNGFFAEHCKGFDSTHKELMRNVDGLKQSVQELQRDITLRRSLTKELTISDMKAKIKQTEELLDTHLNSMEGKQPALEQHWEEALEMIAAEQEVYQAQLQDIGRLKNEVSSVKTIQQKLMSFMASIANVTQRLAPKLASAEHESQHSALLLQICEVQPDSQQRVDAIRTAQEERDFKTANRVNPMDEELIKTKGLLRAPSARKDPSKRLSVEVKEPKESNEPQENKEPKATMQQKDEKEQKDTKVEEVVAETGKKTENPSKELADICKDTQVELKIEHVDEILSLNSGAQACPDETCVSLNLVNDKTAENVSSPSTDSLKSTMPDIMSQVSKVDSSNETSNQADNSESSSSSIVNLPTESDSDVDFSIDSTTSEDAVRPGHVKELIAKVGSFGKGDQKFSEKYQGAKSPTSVERASIWNDKNQGATGGAENKSADVSVNISVGNESRKDSAETVGAEYDRVNQFVALNPDNRSVLTDVTDLSPWEAESSSDENQASSERGEVYVARSLPELAQVFEPGELKKKKKSKTEKD